MNGIGLGNVLEKFNPIGFIDTDLKAALNSITSADSQTFSQYLDQSIQAISNREEQNDKSVLNITTLGMPAGLQYELFGDTTFDTVNNLSDQLDFNNENSKVNNIDNQSMQYDADTPDFSFETTNFNDNKYTAFETNQINSIIDDFTPENNNNSSFTSQDGFKNYMKKHATTMYNTLKKVLPMTDSLLNYN